MDENFLLNRPRAMQLLERMKEAGKSWAFYVFSSVNAIRKYTMEELVQLGVSWIWVGLESPNSTYAKLKNSDTHKLARVARSRYQAAGIDHRGTRASHAGEHPRGRSSTRLSTTPTSTSFMLYTPVPGTPLFLQMEEEKRMLPTMWIWPTSTGNSKFNFKHAAISRDDSPALSRLGLPLRLRKKWPSLYRICETCSRAGSATEIHPDSRYASDFWWTAAS